MTRVLAVVDAGVSSRPVIDVAERLSNIVGVALDVLHVRTEPDTTTDVRTELGDPDSVVLAAVEADDVIAAVIGARALPGGPRPVGHLTNAVIAATTKPVVVVPPDLDTDRRTLSRVLVPVEGGSDVSPDLHQAVSALDVAGAEVLNIHVFDRDRVPAFWEGGRDTELWADEFGRRFAPGPPDAPLEICTGDIATSVLAAVERHHADLVALEWRRTFDGGHGSVVREILSRSPVPVLLVDVTEATNDADDR